MIPLPAFQHPDSERPLSPEAFFCPSLYGHDRPGVVDYLEPQHPGLEEGPTRVPQHLGVREGTGKPLTDQPLVASSLRNTLSLMTPPLLQRDTAGVQLKAGTGRKSNGVAEVLRD